MIFKYRNEEIITKVEQWIYNAILLNSFTILALMLLDWSTIGGWLNNPPKSAHFPMDYWYELCFVAFALVTVIGYFGGRTKKVIFLIPMLVVCIALSVACWIFLWKTIVLSILPFAILYYNLKALFALIQHRKLTDTQTNENLT